MPHYLVVYDLHRKGQNYAAIDAYLGQMKGVRILDTTWIVRTLTPNPVAFTQQLETSAGFDANDRIAVVALSANNLEMNAAFPRDLIEKVAALWAP